MSKELRDKTLNWAVVTPDNFIGKNIDGALGIYEDKPRAEIASMRSEGNTVKPIYLVNSTEFDELESQNAKLVEALKEFVWQCEPDEDGYTDWQVFRKQIAGLKQLLSDMAEGRG